ncbi:MAG: hypothetical protein RLN89_11740, partial [Parvibaculum sp.]
YRGRLSGQAEEVRIDEDLRRYEGAAPITTPPPTPTPGNIPLAPPSAAAPVVTPASAAPSPMSPPDDGVMAPVVEAEDR